MLWFELQRPRPRARARARAHTRPRPPAFQAYSLLTSEQYFKMPQRPTLELSTAEAEALGGATPQQAVQTMLRSLYAPPAGGGVARENPGAGGDEVAALNATFAVALGKIFAHSELLSRLMDGRMRLHPNGTRRSAANAACAPACV